MSQKKNVSKHYTTLLRAEKSFKTAKEKVIQLSRNDKKPMTIQEVMDITKNLQKAGEDDNLHTKLVVRGLGPTRMYTLKGYEDDLKTMDDYENYFSNVASSIKFNKFSQLQINIYTSSIAKSGKFVSREDYKNSMQPKITKAIFKK
jgi:hypothetical protein